MFHQRDQIAADIEFLRRVLAKILQDLVSDRDGRLFDTTPRPLRDGAAVAIISALALLSRIRAFT